jgi:hypothetical protein
VFGRHWWSLIDVFDDCALGAQVDGSVVGGDGRLDDIAVVEVFGVAGLAVEQRLPLEMVMRWLP